MSSGWSSHDRFFPVSTFYETYNFFRPEFLPAGARMTDSFQFEHFIILLYILYLFSLLYHRNVFTIL